MSTCLSVKQVTEKIEHWLRLATLLHGPLKQRLLHVLHNKDNDPLYQGLPEDPSDLYKELSTTHKKTLDNLLRSRVLKKDQMDILLPPNGDNKTFSEAFDVTLIVLLMINCTTLPPPVGGWKQKSPPDTDPSKAANALRGREWRNYLNHTDASSIDEPTFNLKWAEGEALYQGLGGSVTILADLKTMSLDPKHDLVLKSLKDFNTKQEQKIVGLTAKVDNVVLPTQLKHEREIGELNQDMIDLNTKVGEQDEQIGVLKSKVGDIVDVELLFAQLQVISKELEELKKKTDRAELEAVSKELGELKKKTDQTGQSVSKNEDLDFYQTCSEEALLYIAENIGDDWYRFLTNLANNNNRLEKHLTTIQKMQTNGKCGKENVRQFFNCTQLLKWSEVKTALQLLSKNGIDMANYIETKMLYTKGLAIASEQLKGRYIEDLINWYIDQPLAQNEAGINTLSREDAYVDLAVLSARKVDLEWSNSDRKALLEMKHIQSEGIAINDIWEPDDQLVIVRGVAGIGKSTLIKRYVLKWARDEILAGENNKNDKVNFLFFFECRELNTIKDLKTFQELLESKYPEIYKLITMEDLQNIAGQIMIIIDGLDELEGIYIDNASEVQQRQELSNAKTELVRNMINPKSLAVLKGHKTIACGRQKACDIVKENLLVKNIKIKSVEVCGFSTAKALEYIDLFFKHDPEKCVKVKQLMKKQNIRVLSNVPVFLWIICLLYSQDSCEYGIVIDTVTELYVYALIAFLKNHIRGCSDIFDNKNLFELVATREFGNIVISLAKLSVETYMNNKMVFTDEDIHGSIDCPIHLEQTGFIVKYQTGKFTADTYQFRHLVFQEFLCALYLCLIKDVSKYQTNRELSSCTPTIMGIDSLLKENSNKMFISFYQNLTAIHNKTRSYNAFITSPFKIRKYKQFIEKHSFNGKKSKEIIQQFIKIRDDGSRYLRCDPHDSFFEELLRNFKEIGYYIEEDVLDFVRNADFYVITNQYNQAKVVEFLDALKVHKIERLIFHPSYDVFHLIDDELLRIMFWGGVPSLSININLVHRNIDLKKPEFWINKGNVYFCGTYLVGPLPLALKECTSEFILSVDSEYDQNANIAELVRDLAVHVLSCGGKKRLELIYGSLTYYIWQELNVIFGKEQFFEQSIVYR